MSSTYNPKASYAVAHKRNGSYYDLNKMAWVHRPKDYKPEGAKQKPKNGR